MDDKNRAEIEQMINRMIITKDEIKHDIIKPTLDAMSAYHEADLKVIRHDLKMILEQTTKHNSRMTKIETENILQDAKIVMLEKKEIAHSINCPHNDAVRKLQDDALSVSTVKKWQSRLVLLVASLVSIFWMVFMMVRDNKQSEKPTTSSTELINKIQDVNTEPVAII